MAPLPSPRRLCDYTDADSLRAQLDPLLDILSVHVEIAIREGNQLGSVHWRSGLERIASEVSAIRSDLMGLTACAADSP